MQRRNLFKLGLGSFGLAMSTSGFVHAQEPTNDKTNTFDFVVVGAGAAGMAAAVEARSLGASVVVLEKAPRPDGNTFYASGRLCGVGSRYQKDTGDTLEKFVNDAWHETQGVGDKKVIEAFAKESGPSIDWLIDMGVPLTLKKGLPAPNLSRAFFMTTDGTTGGSILMRKLLKKAKDEGVKLLVNTKAFALVTDPEGNVTGVQAKTPDGVKSFMATKGVIITTGGFSANEEMRVMYMGPWAARLNLRGSLRNTGENILMTRPLGAKLVNMTEFYAGPGRTHQKLNRRPR